MNKYQMMGGDGRNLSQDERRRAEIEAGPGSDHDVPYRFTLPIPFSVVHAWAKLTGRVARGEFTEDFPPVLADNIVAETAEQRQRF